MEHPTPPEKFCSRCEQLKPATAFYRNSRNSDNLQSWCKPCCKLSSTLTRLKAYSTFEGRIPRCARRCRENAHRRNQPYTLTNADFLEMWQLQGGICAYTGWNMTLTPKDPTSVSIERIDNKKGYTPDNTILVCNIANRMKSDFPAELFYEVCRAVVNFLGDSEGNLDVAFHK